MINPNEPLADSVVVTASRLGICRAQVFIEIKSGRLAALKAGRRTLITRAAQQDWVSNLPAVKCDAA